MVPSTAGQEVTMGDATEGFPLTVATGFTSD